MLGLWYWHYWITLTGVYRMVLSFFWVINVELCWLCQSLWGEKQDASNISLHALAVHFCLAWQMVLILFTNAETLLYFSQALLHPCNHLCAPAVPQLISLETCWKEQNAQQHGAVWTTGNHLPVVYTLMESWGRVSNNKRQLVFVIRRVCGQTLARVRVSRT